MICILFSSISFIAAVTIFIWTAYLIYGEDKQIRGQGWSFYEVTASSTLHTWIRSLQLAREKKQITAA